jgi:uncharacterized damage-inducible protein DinB
MERVAPFGNKSISDLLEHVAKTYFFWIGEFALSRARPNLLTPSSIKAVRPLYLEVDNQVLEFVRIYENDMEEQVTGSVKANLVMGVSALQLFTHVTTHEFHHKGQILTMSRLLGYTPIDTDIIRF